MPGNPDMRFRTGNIRTETMIFCFFLLSAIFLQPLIKNGFWTQYNRFFGTPKHLASEYNKSDDALYVKYLVKQGTEEIRGEGYCMEASENKVVLLEKNGFNTLDREQYVIKETIPEHTGKQLQFKTIHFINISVDSLNQLVTDQSIKAIEIQSTSPFRFYQNNIPTVATKFKDEYINELILEEIVNPVEITKVSNYENPRIQTIREQIKLIQIEQDQKQNSYKQQINHLQQLKIQIHNEPDLAKKERMLKQINRLGKIKLPNIDSSKIPELHAKIKELKLVDQIKIQEKQTDFQNQLNLTANRKAQLTGFIIIINITNISLP